MEKKYRDALNAKGKVDVFYFDPAGVVLVKDKTSALYDERVDNDFNEALVLNMLYAPDGGAPQGVIEPCIGRRNSETGKVEIVDGRQRTLGCREANRRLKKQGAELLRLPVLLKRANDVRAMAMLVSANEHRTDDSPLNRARKAQRYVDLGRTQAEVGTLLGTSEATVKNLLSLLDAPAAVRSAVESGKVSTTDAYKLARLEPADARKRVAELVEHAPRTPGKKRSKNARKAREIVSGGKPTAAAVEAIARLSAARETAREDWDTRKVEDHAAAKIADWIEKNWVDGWDGDPKLIPPRIRGVVLELLAHLTPPLPPSSSAANRRPGPEGGQPCRRCGIRYSPKTAYVPCFEEGDTLETWMGRQSRTVLDLLPEAVVRGELEKRRASGVVG